MRYDNNIFTKKVNELNTYICHHILHNYDIRPMINFIKNKELRDLVGVEIGTLQARNAYSIMQYLDIKHLYLIDPYIIYDDDVTAYKNRNKDLEKAQQRMIKYKNNITFIKKTSIEAFNDVPSNLDFVYIDGNHSYEYVKKDIELYYPKIKPGGVIGGHDFKAHTIGVVKACLEFVEKNKLKIDGYEYDWWVQKVTNV